MLKYGDAMNEIMADRERRILQLLVESYIKTARPIGSEAAAELYSSPISSATIRNVFMKLDDMGYLDQPHSSAGRIPTEKAYRFYVNSLEDDDAEVEVGNEDLETFYDGCEAEVERIIEATPALLCRITRYAGLVFRSKALGGCFKMVQLISVTAFRAVVILVTTDGIVRRGLISIPDGVTSRDLEKSERFLNNELEGSPTDGICGIVNQRLNTCSDSSRVCIQLASDILESILSSGSGEMLHLQGRDCILEYPEFQDIHETRKLFRVLEGKVELTEILSRDTGEDGIRVYIGSENMHEGIQNCSLVVCSYNAGGSSHGRLGVIGPMRMEYRRVMLSVKAVAGILERQLEDLTVEE